MHSEDPADWERAWTEYLEPLSRSYPDRYADEIKAFRGRTEPVAELRGPAAGRAERYPGSEAERFYQEGVRLCQAGDFAGARRAWERVVAAYAGIEGEARWVELARAGRRPAAGPGGDLHRPPAAAALRQALEAGADAGLPASPRRRPRSSTPWTPCTGTTRTRPRSNR